MVKLGEVKSREFERISFRDWVAKGYAYSGRFQVRVLFPPNKYPTFSLIFQDEKNGMEVRLSLQAQKMKEALNALGVPLKKKDMPAIVLEVEKDGDALMYGLDIEKESPARLEWRGSYWVRRETSETSDDWDELTEKF